MNSEQMYQEFKNALGLSAPGRSFIPNKNEVMIVSYPKSGNTWLRFLLANLLESDVNFKNIEKIVPDIYQNRQFLMRRNNKIYKSHEYYHPGYKKIVLLHRHPSDIFYSYFRYHKKIGRAKDLTSEQYLNLFLKGNMHKSEQWGNWQSHCLSWLCAPTEKLIIRYKDLENNPYVTLKTIAEFCGLDCNEEEIIKAVNASNKKNMRELELRTASHWPSLKGDTGNGYFVADRSALPITPEQDRKIRSAIKAEFSQALSLLGYE